MKLFSKKTSGITGKSEGRPIGFLGGSRGGTSMDETLQAKDMVADLSASLKSGADQQEIAAKRIASLGKTVSKMQSSLRQLDRLQSENARLSHELKASQESFEKKRAWSEEQAGQLTSLKTQRDQLQQELKTAKTDLARLADQDRLANERLRKQATEFDMLRADANNQTERLELATLTTRKSQDSLAEAQTQLSAQTHKVNELENAFEEVSGRLEQKSRLADDTHIALQEMRMERNALKEELFSTRASLQSAEYDLGSKSTMHGEAMKRRVDELTGLKTQTEQLTSQLRIKAEMNQHYEAEVTALRQALASAREENLAQDQRLKATSNDESRNFTALSAAKRDYEHLNAKFTEALKDIEALRKLNQMQRAKLDRFSEINGARIARPDVPESIRPRPGQRIDTSKIIRPKAVNQ